MRKNSSHGYTVLELLTVIFMIAFVIFVPLAVVAVAKNNALFTEEGVTKQLKLERPTVTAIVKIQRNFFFYSIIAAREDGKTVTICLDSDLFANYVFRDCAE